MSRYALAACLFFSAMQAYGQDRIKPRDPPKELSDRDIMYTFERSMLERLEHRVEPVCEGVQFATSGRGLRPAVVETYVQASTGRVIFVEAVEAQDRALADALKKAVMQWRFEASEDTETVIAMPTTFFYSGSPRGTCGS